MDKALRSKDGKTRCFWSAEIEDFFPYHDKEWGFPVKNDRKLFEKLCLEGFQSGLSWRTILMKRENFREAFRNFDFNAVADFGSAEIRRLMKNEGIVRHRGKIEAVINNAKRIKELIDDEGSFAAYIWRHEPDPEKLPKPMTVSSSEASVLISKDLKKRGWKFVGPTTVYSFLQAMGVINDHASSCPFRKAVDQKKKNFKRPKPVKGR